MLQFSTDVQVDWLKIWNRMDNNGNFEDVINGVEVSHLIMPLTFDGYSTIRCNMNDQLTRLISTINFHFISFSIKRVCDGQFL